MSSKITKEQRAAVLQLLAEGCDREMIASRVGLTRGQVSAISAHVTMGRYALPKGNEGLCGSEAQQTRHEQIRTLNLLYGLEGGSKRHDKGVMLGSVLLGRDVETGELAF